jgi:hypothetical protein
MSITPGEGVQNNYILSFGPEPKLEFIRPHFELARLHMGEIIEEARQPVRFL